MFEYEENNNQLKTMRRNLRLLREEKNWSVEELSQVSKIDIEILIGIENEKEFGVECLFKICRVYNMKIYEIFLPINKPVL